jgi:hypothetical protein
MKKNYLITMVFLFMLIYYYGILAQTEQTKLNQVEFMKQFIGKWKSEIGKDTTLVCEFKSFGGGLELMAKSEIKGKIIFEEKALIGYDKTFDKLIQSSLVSIDSNSNLKS